MPECVVMRRRESLEGYLQHLHALLGGSHPDGYQEEVVHYEGNERYGELPQVQLHGSSQSMDVFKLGQVSTHICMF